MSLNIDNPMIDYAIKYVSLGFPVFPCDRKLPATKNGVKDATLSEDAARAFFKHRGHNIAIALPYGFSAYDVDPRNGGQDTWDDFTGKNPRLPDTVMQLTGGGGTHYIFQIPPGYRLRKLGPGVDVKHGPVQPDGTYGHYLLVEPSLHPKTGRVYEWEASSNPLEGIRPAMAPEWLLVPVDEDQADNVVQLKGAGFILPEQIPHIRAALQFFDVDGYHDWVYVGMALHATGAGEPAFDIWRQWSTQSSKYTLKGCRGQWCKFRPPQVIGKGLVLESIFKEAQHRGWVNPLSNAASNAGPYDDLSNPDPYLYQDTLQEINGVLIGDAATAPETITAPALIPEPPQFNFQTIPIPAIEALSSWIKDQLPLYCPRAVQAAALSLASVLASRQYRTIEGKPALNYWTVISPSAGTLRQLKGVCFDALKLLQQRHMIRAGIISTPVILLKALYRSPCLYHFFDNYGQTLQFSKRQPSGQKEDVLDLITDLNAGHNQFLDSDTDALWSSNSDPMIYAPNFIMLALVSDDQLPLLIKRSEFGRGALEQMITVNGGDLLHNPRPQPGQPLPDICKSTVEQLRRDDEHKGNLSDVEGSCIPKQPILVNYQSGARECYADLQKQLKKLAAQCRITRPMALIVGAIEHAERLSLVLAAWENPAAPMISRSHAQFACHYIKEHFSYLASRIEIAGLSDDKEDVYQQVKEYVAQRGKEGATRRDLARNCRKFRSTSADKQADVLNYFVGNSLFSKVVRTASNGVKSDVYIYHTFSKAGDLNLYAQLDTTINESNED